MSQRGLFFDNLVVMFKAMHAAPGRLVARRSMGDVFRCPGNDYGQVSQ